MTEREKMLAGELYDCGDAELLSQWHKAKDLVRAYNLVDSEDREEKDRILGNCWGEQGKTSGSRPRFLSTMAIISISGIIVR